MSVRYRPKTVGPCQASVAGLVLLGALGGWLGGCASGPADPTPTGAGTTVPADLPAGAIRVGHDLYQVPIGTDADGCPIYRLYSRSLMVTEAISYRSRAGGFTIDKRTAVCDQGLSVDPSPTPSRSPAHVGAPWAERAQSNALHGGGGLDQAPFGVDG